MRTPDKIQRPGIAQTLPAVLACLFLAFALQCKEPLRVGSSLYVVERDSKVLAVVDMDTFHVTSRIPLDADLRHASMVFDPALKYGYIATRNGKLNRIDLETRSLAGVLETSKNSIGLGISQDGVSVAISEYEPGGITIVDTRTFTVKSRIAAEKDGKASRVTGLVDGPDNTFLCALMDSNEIWMIGRETPENPDSPYRVLRKFEAAAQNPFDGLITPDGRYYVNAHFNSGVLSLVDLWNPAGKARAITFGPASTRAPVKMPHMGSWASAGEKIFVAAPGEHKLHVIDAGTFAYSHSIDLIGDGVYTVVHPFMKEVWVTFSGDVDGKIQIIDTRTEKTIRVLETGKKVYHLAFTPRGERAFISANQSNELFEVRTIDYKITRKIPMNSPSGIFGVWRAWQIGL